MDWRHVFPIALLVATSASATAEVVLDSDDNAATLSGTWTQATNVAGFYGSDFAVAPGTGSAESARFFSPRAISSSGTWCIQARWTAGANRTNAAKYQVFDGTVLRNTFTVNQRVNGGAWRRLGCVALTSGKISEVQLSDVGVIAQNVVVADGVRWVWDEVPVSQNFCIAVNGGFGAGGTTFVGKGFAMPGGGNCRPWSGIMRTATTVVGNSTGAGCLSDDAKLLTITIQTTAPSFLGANVATNHIELCPAAATLGCPAAGGQSAQGTNFTGPAARIACTTILTTIPSTHD